MRTFNSIAARLTPATLLPTLLLLVSSCSTYKMNGDGSRSYTIAGIIYLIMFFYALFSLLKQDWSFSKKLIWGAIILFFPIGGSIIYLLFSGRSS